MPKKIFKVGDRVSDISYQDEHTGDMKYGLVFTEWMNEPQYGVITEILSDGKVLISWDSEWLNTNPHSFETKCLMLEDDVEAKLTILEKEFKVVSKQVSVKLKEAAKLLREANKLSKKTGNSLSDMDVGPLYNAMNACGWRTSSFGC